MHGLIRNNLIKTYHFFIFFVIAVVIIVFIFAGTIFIFPEVRLFGNPSLGGLLFLLGIMKVGIMKPCVVSSSASLDFTTPGLAFRHVMIGAETVETSSGFHCSISRYLRRNPLHLAFENMMLSFAKEAYVAFLLCLLILLIGHSIEVVQCSSVSSIEFSILRIPIGLLVLGFYGLVWISRTVSNLHFNCRPLIGLNIIV